MIRFFCTLLLCLLLTGTVSVHAAGLPDTGQDTCYDDTAADVVPAADPASIARDAGTHPRQDCRYGRDAAAMAGVLAKTGGGVHGFDYSKIANDGTVLTAAAPLGTGATDWACSKDNTTELTWEVKTTTATDLRFSGHTYTWYSTNGATNGGNTGITGSNTCNATLPGSLCNTQAYVTAVNGGAGLCGATDWRMPTQRELLTLVNADGSNPSIDPTYFPNIPALLPLRFWSGTTYAGFVAQVWIVDFDDGTPNRPFKLNTYHARLVRGGPF